MMINLKPVLCVAAILLTACSTVNPITALKLSTLDPFTADPEQIALRIDLPEGLEIPQGGAQLSLYSAREDTGQSLSGDFDLVVGEGAWRLAERDIPEMRHLQTTIGSWESEAPNENSGGFSVALKGCTTGDGPDHEATVAADISLDGGATFLPLIRGLTVGQVLEHARLEDLPLKCAPR